MDARPDIATAPFRDPRYAPRRLEVERRPDGTVILFNATPIKGAFATVAEPLAHWAAAQPDRVWLAERDGEGWRTLTYGEGHARVSALEQDPELARTFFSRVRVMQYGGANLSQEIGDRIQAVAVATVGERISFGSGYGATETGPTAANVHWPNARMGMMGLPIPGTSVKLAPEGDRMEFRVKGPQITPGYLGLPEVSAASFDEDGFYRLGDAARWIDPEDPYQGLAFDGRLSENFKLASGTFVSVGELRISAVGAVGDPVTDAVVCGEGQENVGLLFYPKPGFDRPVIEVAVRAGVEKHNAGARGSGGKVVRALVLDSAPDANAGEITDKGYIAQALARNLRAQAVADLFAQPPGPGVMEFSQG